MTTGLVSREVEKYVVRSRSDYGNGEYRERRDGKSAGADVTTNMAYTELEKVKRQKLKWFLR